MEIWRQSTKKLLFDGRIRRNLFDSFKFDSEMLLCTCTVTATLNWLDENYFIHVQICLKNEQKEEVRYLKNRLKEEIFSVAAAVLMDVKFRVPQ